MLNISLLSLNGGRWVSIWALMGLLMPLRCWVNCYISADTDCWIIFLSSFYSEVWPLVLLFKKYFKISIKYILTRTINSFNFKYQGPIFFPFPICQRCKKCLGNWVMRAKHCFSYCMQFSFFLSFRTGFCSPVSVHLQHWWLMDKEARCQIRL